MGNYFRRVPVFVTNVQYHHHKVRFDKCLLLKIR